jgi:quercetin dioxygenase-like cupin family protein
LDKKNIYKTDEKQPQGEQPDFYTNKFIGNFEIRRIFNESDSEEQEMYHVTFKNGAMTKIHAHESEQILIATISPSENSNNHSDVGTGFVVIIEKGKNTTSEEDYDPKFDISKTIFLDKIGDTVCIPPNVLHCHGSANKEQDFSHIAIRRSTLDSAKQAKTLWEYDIQAMKELMSVMDDNKVSSILSNMHNKIKMVISG